MFDATGNVCHFSSDMKTIVIRDFTRDFSKHRSEPCQVMDRGTVVGTWTPVANPPPKVNWEERRRKAGFTKALPFTGQELLKAHKR